MVGKNYTDRESGSINGSGPKTRMAAVKPFNYGHVPVTVVVTAIWQIPSFYVQNEKFCFSMAPSE